jgi:hypothetical protein
MKAQQDHVCAFENENNSPRMIGVDVPMMVTRANLANFILSVILCGLVVCSPFSTNPARAYDDDSLALLKSMTDYVGKQQQVVASFDTDIEIITPDLEKIQFASSSQLMLSRPDKVRLNRLGGYADVELSFDGKKVSLYSKNINVVSQAEFQGTVDQLVDKLRNDLGVDAPGADLMLSRSFDELTSDLIEARHIGRGVIDGIECEHLAFRGSETDWQIWIEVGANPIPRKYVITSKMMTGAPQYTLRVRDWKTGSAFSVDAFVLKPAADAKKVNFNQVSNLDEVPAGVPAGVKK